MTAFLQRGSKWVIVLYDDFVRRAVRHSFSRTCGEVVEVSYAD